MKKILSFSISVVFSHTCLAMFCPTNFNPIQIGDNIDYVKKQCGEPTTANEQTIPEDQPQEWVYFVNSDPSNKMTTRLTVGFEKDHVVNLTISGLSVGTSQACRGGLVSVGNTQKAVQAACGKPNMINQTNNPNNSNAPATQITVLTYSNAATTVNLTFENGRLK